MSGRRRLVRLEAPGTRLAVHRGRARSGMDVWVAPMRGFRTLHAVVAARFGSRDVALADGTPLPEGTAHFLEHEMFQKADGDLFLRFEARGASANAYTTFSTTAFLFSSPGDLAANVTDLLEGVRRLEVDEAGVLRERAIIGQEIAMYDDDPGWRGMLELLGALYHRHPVRTDIAGTRDSIQRIDLPLLRRAQEAAYRPANLVLVVAGDVDPGEVLDLADATGADGPARGRGGRIRRAPWGTEPRRVRRREAVLGLDVSRPHVHLGIKETPPRGRAARRRMHVEGALVMDLLFGHGGMVEAPLYREGWTDESLGAGYEAEGDYAHAIVSAEVDDAGAYRRRLAAALAEVARAGLDARRLERSRRRAVGQFLRTFNAPESVAQWLLGHAVAGEPLDARWALLLAADPRRLERRLREMVAAPRSWAVLLPLEAAR